MVSRASQPVIIAILIVAAAFVFAYHAVIADLVHDWATDGNYSHGFAIVPLALYFAWQRREAFAAAPLRPSAWGLFLLAGSMAVFTAGLLGAELFLTRVSMIGCVAAAIVFLCGWRWLRIAAFPLAVLLLMIPLPAIVFNQVAFPLQLVASRFGEQILHAADVPVLREGNLIVLSNTTLEVAEACSGIRSLVSLVTVGVAYGALVESSLPARIALVAATIPIAIVTNGLRVAGTGLAAHYVGAQAADGFFHTFSGWLMFVGALLLLGAVHGSARLVKPLWPREATW
jgi:exosortase